MNFKVLQYERSQIPSPIHGLGQKIGIVSTCLIAITHAS